MIYYSSYAKEISPESTISPLMATRTTISFYAETKLPKHADGSLRLTSTAMHDFWHVLERTISRATTELWRSIYRWITQGIKIPTDVCLPVLFARNITL